MTQELKEAQETEVLVKVDSAVKRLWLDAIEALAATMLSGAVAWHKRYELVATIIQHIPPLYLAGGYSTEAEFFLAELQESRSAVYRNLRTVKLATAEEVAKYSAYRLNYGIAYVEAKTKKPIENRGAIDFETLRIQFEREDGKRATKTLREISLADLKEAVSQVTAGDAKPTKKSRAAKAVVDAVKRSGVKGAQATVTKTKITLRAPLSGLAAIARELTDFKVPSEE